MDATTLSMANAFTNNRAVPKSLLAVNVKDTLYGAKGDGTTNDTAAFVAARAAAVAQGKSLSIPTGHYKIDPDVLTDWAGAKIAGESFQTVRLTSSGTTASGVGITVTSSDSEISGIEFRGFMEGIRCTTHGTRIHNCLLNYNLVGIHLQNNCYLSRINDNNITFNTGIGILIGNVNYQTTIHHNIIDNNKGIGVAIYGASGGLIISDNSIEGNRDYTSGVGCGMLVSGLYQSRFRISNNWFELNGTTENSVDLLFMGPPEQTEYYALFTNILSSIVPAAYQSLFVSATTSGTFVISNNTFTFTQYGAVVTAGALGTAVIRENSFKGSLGVYNKHICLNANAGYLGRYIISNNGYQNTDYPAIDAQVSTGIAGTIVQSNMASGVYPTIRYNNGPLYPEVDPIPGLTASVLGLLRSSLTLATYVVSTGIVIGTDGNADGLSDGFITQDWGTHTSDTYTPSIVGGYQRFVATWNASGSGTRRVGANFSATIGRDYLVLFDVINATPSSTIGDSVANIVSNSTTVFPGTNCTVDASGNGVICYRGTAFLTQTCYATIGVARIAGSSRSFDIRKALVIDVTRLLVDAPLVNAMPTQDLANYILTLS